MEQLVLSEDDRLLDITLPIRITIQNQLLEFVIAHLEESFEATEGKSFSQNPYALFIIEELSVKYAVWFDTLCVESRVEGEDLRSPMTEKEFKDLYAGKPRLVLAEIISHRGYKNVDEYLRELEEWFKVKPVQEQTDETSQNSVLTVPLAAALTRRAVSDLVGETRSTSV